MIHCSRVNQRHEYEASSRCFYIYLEKLLVFADILQSGATNMDLSCFDQFLMSLEIFARLASCVNMRLKSYFFDFLFISCFMGGEGK